MLLHYVILVSIASTAVAESSTTETDDSTGRCILPPYPKHGSYLASPAGVPGDNFERVIFYVICEQGYHLVGDGKVSCLSGYWSEIPECLPYCQPGNKSGVIACEANVPRCVIEPTNLPSFGSRTKSSGYNCGYVGPETDRIIAGGSVATVHDAPWHAGIYIKTTNPYMQICGGTLIAKDVVVTAAHCFSQDGSVPPASQYAIAVGKIYRPWNNEHDKGVQKSDVEEIRIPPRYLGAVGNYQDDIALITVSKGFYFSDYVRPACVSFDQKFDDEQLRQGNHGKVFGWGLTGENSLASQVLQFADLPFVNIHKCIKQSPVSFRSSITSDKICAGYTNGTSVCRGDSGGGLLFPEVVRGKERFFLRGVVSTSPSTDNACNIYTWATFTHILKHESFLKTFISSPEVFTVPVNQPASSLGEYPVSNLDFKIQTQKPMYDGWI